VRAVKLIVNHTSKGKVPLTIREFFKTYTLNALALSKKNRLFDYILLTVVIFLLVLVKPFGIEQISFSTIGYWLVICIAGFCLYAPMFYFGEKYLLTLKLPYPLVLILLAVITGFLMCFVVTFTISVYFDIPAEYWARLPVLFPQTLIIGGILICITMIRDYIKHQNNLLEQNRLLENKQDTLYKFMLKLPKELRGELLCLEMDDHYIKVHTDKGRHMLLMRMKDAISELEGLKGLQAHRSWWISEGAIMGSVKEGRNTFLNLKSDITVPVSRTYLPELKLRKLL
jgi:hypothetical protein